MTEVGPKQELPLFGGVLLSAQARAGLFEAVFEKRTDLRVALPEFRLHLLPKSACFGFRQRHDLGANPRCSGVVRLKEWSKQYPRAVGVQSELGALNCGGFHQGKPGYEAGRLKTVTAFCMS